MCGLSPLLGDQVGYYSNPQRKITGDLPLEGRVKSNKNYTWIARRSAFRSWAQARGNTPSRTWNALATESHESEGLSLAG